MANAKSYEAIVEKIIHDGRHGPYAVARCNELKTVITFNLSKTVWEEEIWPERGACVVLSRLFKKPSGWRATKARFLQPADETGTN